MSKTLAATPQARHQAAMASHRRAAWAPNLPTPSPSPSSMAPPLQVVCSPASMVSTYRRPVQTRSAPDLWALLGMSWYFLAGATAGLLLAVALVALTPHRAHDKPIARVVSSSAPAHLLVVDRPAMVADLDVPADDDDY